jgi:hypothetical protein
VLASKVVATVYCSTAVAVEELVCESILQRCKAPRTYPVTDFL